MAIIYLSVACRLESTSQLNCNWPECAIACLPTVTFQICEACRFPSTQERSEFFLNFEAFSLRPRLQLSRTSTAKKARRQLPYARLGAEFPYRPRALNFPDPIVSRVLMLMSIS